MMSSSALFFATTTTQSLLADDEITLDSSLFSLGSFVCCKDRCDASNKLVVVIVVSTLTLSMEKIKQVLVHRLANTKIDVYR